MITTRYARASDYSYILHLQRKFSEQLGFIPSSEIAKACEDQRIRVALQNNQHVGYVLTYWRQNPSGSAPVLQVAVQMDAQRTSAGSHLIQQLRIDALSRHYVGLKLSCRATVEAHAFFLANEFYPVAMFEGGKKRKQVCIVWSTTRDLYLSQKMGADGRRLAVLRILPDAAVTQVMSLVIESGDSFSDSIRQVYLNLQSDQQVSDYTAAKLAASAFQRIGKKHDAAGQLSLFTNEPCNNRRLW